MLLPVRQGVSIALRQHFLAHNWHFALHLNSVHEASHLKLVFFSYWCVLSWLFFLPLWQVDIMFMDFGSLDFVRFLQSFLRLLLNPYRWKAVDITLKKEILGPT